MTSRRSHSGVLSRRRFLQALGLVGISSGICGPALFSSEKSLPSTTAFEEIAASTSGISWTHVSGRSPMAHLPETVGAGCAFLDYDNDGWMDIYLVNSGPCDFYEPSAPLRNALYHNNRDGTFTDVTQRAACREMRTAWAWRLATTMATVFLIYTSPNIRTASCITTMETARSRMSPPRRESRRRVGRPVRCGSITTMTDASICSSAVLSITAKQS